MGRRLAHAGAAHRSTRARASPTTTTERIVRITEVARRVKELHGSTCQVCGAAVSTPAGPYVEASHVRPLGRPHDGPDDEGNLLALCPNDHVRFDTGGIIVRGDLAIVETAAGSTIGRLRTVR